MSWVLLLLLVVVLGIVVADGEFGGEEEGEAEEVDS